MDTEKGMGRAREEGITNNRDDVSIGGIKSIRIVIKADSFMLSIHRETKQ